MDFHFFDPRAEVDVTHGHLPHWEQRDAYYFITFRTADSIPLNTLKQWHYERDVWLVSRGIDPAKEDWQVDLEHLPEDEHREFYRSFTARWHDHLDQGHGSCLLRQPETSAIVAENLKHFDGDRYQLDSFVVMPNHVHVLVRPFVGMDLADLLHSWKSYTAKEINKHLERSGELWEPESYDTLVRDVEHLWKALRYIGKNPAKASLPESQWVRYVHPSWEKAGWGLGT